MSCFLAITQEKMSEKVIFCWSSTSEKWASVQSCRDHGIHRRNVSVDGELWEFDSQQDHRQKYKIGYELNSMGAALSVSGILLSSAFFKACYIISKSN